MSGLVQRTAMRPRRRALRSSVILAAALAAFYHGLGPSSPKALAAVGVGASDSETETPVVAETPDAGFMTKVIGAAAQGAVAAIVAALLSAFTEPVVNRVLRDRVGLMEAIAGVQVANCLKFLPTTISTNMMKFPMFEMITVIMSFTSLSGGLRGTISGFFFCTMMLPVTNFRFVKSFDPSAKITPEVLYKAYIPTVARDIVYGWCRGFVNPILTSALGSESQVSKAFVFGLTVFISCVVSAPGNEWRGYTLQDPKKKLPPGEFFQAERFIRSTSVGATVMGIALFMGFLITPYAEAFFSYLRETPMVAGTFALGIGGVIFLYIMRSKSQ